MKFNFEIGKIYDAIFFGCLHFHKEVVFEKLQKELSDPFSSTATIDDLYHEANEHLPLLPAILSPFFCPQDNRISALTQFFVEEIDFSQDTLDSFLHKITTNSELLYTKLVNTFLFGASPSESDTYVQVLSESAYPPEFKLQISLLFGNYPYAVSLLTDFLRKIYDQITLLHEKHEQEVAKTKEQVQGKNNPEAFEQIFQHRYSKPFRKELLSYASISVLDTYLTYLNEDRDLEHSVMIFGTQYAESLKILAGADPQCIFYALGNKTRFSILKTLAEQGEMTAAGIARALQLPASTAIAQVDFLYQNGLLSFVRKKGLQIFYKLNYPVLRSTFRLANEYLNEWEQKGKENRGT